MTPQERDLITTLLDRLNKTEGQPKDPEAETLIQETVTAWPDVSYSLAQTVLIQDPSLHNAQSRITDLEAQLIQTKPTPSTAPSFLGSLGDVFGRGEPSGLRTSNVPPGGPGTGPPPLAATLRPQPDCATGAGLMGGGGFLRSAAITRPASPAACCSSTASSRCSDITLLPALPVARLQSLVLGRPY